MQQIVRTIGRLVFLLTMIMVFSLVVMVEMISFRGLENKSLPKFLQANASEYSSIAILGDNQTLSYGEVESVTMTDDARPLLIRRYLEKYKSPLLEYSDLIYSLSKTYGFEYYWMVAIAQQESNLCKKIPEDSHNCWGYGINSAGTLKFENYETALRSFAEYLKREYFDKGLNTPELIMKKYCPHSDGSWAYGVNKFIDQLETGNF